MRRSSVLILILAVVLLFSSCGGSDRSKSVADAESYDDLTMDYDEADDEDWDNEDEDLCGELSSPMYKVESVIKVESKPDMKKRGVKSPNIADAHILTCYLPSEDYHLTNYKNSDTIFSEQASSYSPFDEEAGY